MIFNIIPGKFTMKKVLEYSVILELMVKINLQNFFSSEDITEKPCFQYLDDLLRRMAQNTPQQQSSP